MVAFQALRLVMDVHSVFASLRFQSGLPPSTEFYLVAREQFADTEDLSPLPACSREGHEHQVTVAKGWALCGVNWRGHSVGDP